MVSTSSAYASALVSPPAMMRGRRRKSGFAHCGYVSAAIAPSPEAVDCAGSAHIHDHRRVEARVYIEGVLDDLDGEKTLRELAWRSLSAMIFARALASNSWSRSRAASASILANLLARTLFSAASSAAV